MIFKGLFNNKKFLSYEKIFIKVLIFKFIIITSAYFLGMEYLVRKYVLKYDHDFKRSIIFKKSETKNTIWGDSGTMTAINNLENFVNFSSGSQNFQEIELKMKKYYSNKGNGGKVILQLPLNGFAPYRDRKISDAIKSLYFKNSKINIYMSYNYFRERSYEYLKNYLKNNFKIIDSSKNQFNPDGSVSYLKKYQPIIPNLALSKKKYKDIYAPKLNFKNDKNKKALKRIIEFISASNMELCLVTTPWHKDHFIFKSALKKYDPIREHYKYISKYSKSEYYDFTEINYPSFYFSDPLHLSIYGANQFTNLIANKCFISLDNVNKAY